MRKHCSDFLFADTDFITGAGSVLNIAGNYFNFAISEDENDADFKAMKSDWGKVGQDLFNAISQAQELSLIENDLIAK